MPIRLTKKTLCYEAVDEEGNISMWTPPREPGGAVHVANHPSVLNGCNALVLQETPDDCWLITLQGNKNPLAPDGIRGVLPLANLHDGLKSQCQKCLETAQ